MDTLPPLPATLPDMMYLEPAGVVAGPRLNLGGVTVYSGYFSLVANTAFRGVIHAEDRQAFSFFVPESDPYTQPPSKTWLELSLRRIRSTGSPVHVGVYDEQVDVVPDPRGGEHRWLQISVQLPVSSIRAIAINYRLTVES